MAVLVFTEHWDGQFKKSTFELVSYAYKLAEMANTQTVALCIGEVDEETPGGHAPALIHQIGGRAQNEVRRDPEENVSLYVSHR